MIEHTGPEDSEPTSSEPSSGGSSGPESTRELLSGLEDEDHAKGLASVAALRALVDRAEATHVRRARDNGWTWRQIGAVLGVSRQSVHKKHAGRRHS